MNIKEVIGIRDRLRNELSIVEKFLEIAKREGALAEDVQPVGPAPSSPRPAAGDASQRELIPKVEGYGSIGETVERAVNFCPQKFKLDDVSEALKQLDMPLTRIQISTVIARLVKKEKITVLEQRVGSKPATYAKTA